MDSSKIYILLTISIIGITLTQAIKPALILTPYIEENKTEVARNLSIVDPSLFLNVTSHSGFLTVDPTHGSNLFFWYFPNNNTPSDKTPWIIWLQGGPGASSLAGLFNEIGPFEYNSDTGLKRRKTSWCLEYSVVFIDNPVGAGFSFTNSKDGYAKDMAMVSFNFSSKLTWEKYSDHLYKAVEQLVVLFPELQTSPLYVAGESYAGHYIPAFGHKTIQENAKSKGNVPYNLKGLIMGNPVLDRGSVKDYTSVFYNWGLIDSQGVLAASSLQKQYNEAIDNEDGKTAVELRDKLLNKLQDIAWQSQVYNAINNYADFKTFMDYIKLEAVREALHVGSIEFTFSNHSVHTYLVSDFLAKMSPIMTAVLERYNVLIYCGQLDLTAPCVPAGEWRRRTWQWENREKFLDAPRLPWWYDGQVAGYVKKGGGFTEALIKGAGHLAPIEKPEQVSQLVTYFIRGLELPLPPNYVTEIVPPYEQPSQTNSFKTAFAVSAGFNIVLVVVAVLLAVYVVRWRRREADFFYAPLSDGILTMS